MILLQIIIFVTFIFLIIGYSYIVITPCLLFGNLPMIDYIKTLGQSLLTTLLINGFNTKFKILKQSININNLINENIDLIDIIICNHISACDIPILTTYLKHFNIDSYNFVLKNDIVYSPGIGLITYASSDIKVNRNWTEDKKLISKQLDKINNNGKKQIILIFPEGTRLSEDKLKEAQTFSINNNMPVFKNVLVPKSKGLQTIITNLKESKKLGRIWDTTLIMPKFIGKSVNVIKLLGKSLDNIYMKWEQVHLPDNFNSNDIFKNWLLNIWVKKDIFIQNYKDYNYEDINSSINIKLSEKIYIMISLLVFFSLLINKYGRYYLLCSMILSYMLIFFKL